MGTMYREWQVVMTAKLITVNDFKVYNVCYESGEIVLTTLEGYIVKLHQPKGDVARVSLLVLDDDGQKLIGTFRYEIGKDFVMCDMDMAIRLVRDVCDRVYSYHLSGK